MSQIWADRQRRTQQLIRAIAPRVLDSPLDTDGLLGLCQLTWITSSYVDSSTGYITSVKLPALGRVMKRDFSAMALDDVARDMGASARGSDLARLVSSHSGFTNFYNAYRNSAHGWMDANRKQVRDIFRRAYALRTDDEAYALARTIDRLDAIPKPRDTDVHMPAASLITPVCFALDPRLRFPIVNGRHNVRALLRQVGAGDQSLDAKVRALARLIGRGGIRDAADLDQWQAQDLVEIGDDSHEPAHQQLGERKVAGGTLPLKDEEDLTRLQAALTTAQRRIHNRMTNDLRQLLRPWHLTEGCAEDCRYDVLVSNYDGHRNDLLLEVKSSSDASQVRMAIGQVYAYWHRLKGPTDDPHIAVVLPERPDDSTLALLEWREIGVLWFEDGRLETSTQWLVSFADQARAVA